MQIQERSTNYAGHVGLQAQNVANLAASCLESAIVIEDKLQQQKNLTSQIYKNTAYYRIYSCRLYHFEHCSICVYCEFACSYCQIHDVFSNR